MIVVRLVVSEKDREFISLRKWLERRILGVWGITLGDRHTVSREFLMNSAAQSRRG